MGKLGLVLVFGGAIGAVSNILILRLEGWLLANDNTVEGSTRPQLWGRREQAHRSAQRRETEVISALMPTRTSRRGKKESRLPRPSSRSLRSLASASSAPPKARAYNYANAYSDTTSITLEYWSQKGSNANKLVTTTQVKRLPERKKFSHRRWANDHDFARYLRRGRSSSTGEVYDSDNQDHLYRLLLRSSADQGPRCQERPAYDITSNFGSIVTYPTLRGALDGSPRTLIVRSMPRPMS
jgi:hypothetical protein